MAIMLMELVPLIGIRTTTTSTSAEIPSTIPVQGLDAFEKLVKSMEDMSLQGEKIIKLQEEVKKPARSKFYVPFLSPITNS
jgi:hypothetical protein